MSASVPSAASREGSRKAMRQLRTTSKLAASVHISTGGLSAYSSLPRCGNIQSPPSTICLAASVKRGSSAGQGSRIPIPAPITTRAISISSQKRRRSCGLAWGEDMGDPCGTANVLTGLGLPGAEPLFEDGIVHAVQVAIAGQDLPAHGGGLADRQGERQRVCDGRSGKAGLHRRLVFRA